jgi:hypothetical protein
VPAVSDEKMTSWQRPAVTNLLARLSADGDVTAIWRHRWHDSRNEWLNQNELSATTRPSTRCKCAKSTTRRLLGSINGRLLILSTQRTTYASWAEELRCSASPGGRTHCLDRRHVPTASAWTRGQSLCVPCLAPWREHWQTRQCGLTKPGRRGRIGHATYDLRTACAAVE